LNTVIDLKNQPKLKRPKLTSATTDSGETYIIYDPNYPNEYDVIAAKLGRKPANKMNQQAKDTQNKLNKFGSALKQKYAAYTGNSSSDDEDTRQNRGGGAQIAPPSLMEENNQKLTPARPINNRPKNHNKPKITPLFKRKQTRDHDPLKPTIVIVIKNIVGPNQVDADLKSEVVQECEKYGTILDSKIIDISEIKSNVEEIDAVRIFLKFSSISDSQNAVTGLNQRIFGGRVLYSAFFDVAKFDKNELDGLC